MKHIRILGPAKDLNAVRTSVNAEIRVPDVTIGSNRAAIRLRRVDGLHMLLCFDNPDELREWAQEAWIRTVDARSPSEREALWRAFSERCRDLSILPKEPKHEAGHGLSEAERLKAARRYPECGHSGCRQNWIETGQFGCFHDDTEIVTGGGS